MRKFLAGLAFALTLFAPLVSFAQVVKLGTLAPEGSVWYNVLREMGEEWKKASNGRVQLRIYPGGVAGDDADMVRKMRIGQLQAAAVTGHGLETIDADAGVFQTPMLLRTDGELDYVREKLSGELSRALEAKGFKVLYWSEVGWVYLFSNKPVVKPADLKPLDVWVWSGDAAWADALKDSGYKPVALPATEITTALSSGLIDAFATTPVAALSYQWFGLAKNMMNLKWAPLTAAVVVSKKTWDQIPDDVKPALEAAAKRAGDAAKAEIRRMEAEAITAMEGYGLKVNPVAPAVAAEWQAEIQKTYPKLLGKSVPKEIYERAAAILAAYRSETSGE